MKRLTLTRALAAAALGASALAVAPLAPASAALPAGSAGPAAVAAGPHAGHAHGTADPACFTPGADIATSARGGQVSDHRDISRREQRAIERRTQRILARDAASERAKPGGGTGGTTVVTGGTIPVYVHVMAAADGTGNVTDSQITQQIAVLNATYGGQESSAAARTGFTFSLAGTDRFYNDTWHVDGASSSYRKATRKGGAGALNIWLVDFDYLGIATFPWDYARNGGIDGIRVNYASLPGGPIANYNLGETTTHEAGHWLGLYHTFQGGCTTTNDEVGDTPAQSSATSGCPEGRDSCSLAGLDPIHNYMDYSYDACYNQFTAGQSTRMSQMFSAYRR